MLLSTRQSFSLRIKLITNSVIQRQIEKFLNKKHIQKPTITTTPNESSPKQRVYLVLPYFNSKVDDFKRLLSDLVRTYYPNVDFRVMFTAPTTLANLFSFKDKTPFLLRSLVVYKVACSECSDFYIGKTARCLIRRIEKHKQSTGKDEYIY